MSDFARGLLHSSISRGAHEIIVSARAYGPHVYDRMTIEHTEERIAEVRKALAEIEATIAKAKAERAPELKVAAE